jgi:ribosomal protein S18 acetylase RimI-like enzyme
MSVTEEFGIRSGLRGEAAQILELWQISGALPTATDSSEGISCLLDSEKDALIVAEADGRIVGTVIAAWDGWRGNLYRLVVAPGSRRQGIATRLVAEAERRLSERGAVRLSILVPESESARGFWLAMEYLEDARVIRSVKTLGGRDSRE